MSQPALIDSEPGFVTVCAQCRGECAPWGRSVNITPDALFIECDLDVWFQAPVVEMDVAFDWCSLTCFGRWIFAAAAYMQSPVRPPE